MFSPNPGHIFRYLVHDHVTGGKAGMSLQFFGVEKWLKWLIGCQKFAESSCNYSSIIWLMFKINVKWRLFPVIIIITGLVFQYEFSHMLDYRNFLMWLKYVAKIPHIQIKTSNWPSWHSCWGFGSDETVTFSFCQPQHNDCEFDGTSGFFPMSTGIMEEMGVLNL